VHHPLRRTHVALRSMFRPAIPDARPREAPAKGCPGKISNPALKKLVLGRILGLKKLISDRGHHVFFKKNHSPARRLTRADDKQLH
jgi:hypothetical protein